MFEFLRQLGAGIAHTWGRLTVSARANLVIAGALTLALIAGVVFFGSQPQYGRLYNRLSLDESNEISVYLTDNGIPFRLRDGGTAIDVPVNDISRARVALSAQNLPKSQGVVPGFELFDSRDLMSNRFLDNVDYTRAVQGELQRQLNQFDFIRNAYVFIREAPEQLFISDQRPSEATVTLDTGGQPLTKAQVKAVVNTVASFGGANLSPKSIHVATTDGTLLHSPSDDQFARLAGDQLEYQIEYEQSREKKLIAQFKEIGKRAVVNVSATFDWTSEEKKQREVSKGATVSSLETSDVTEDMEREAQGTPGAIANIPDELTQRIPTGIRTESTETLENFEPSETNTTTTRRPGTLKKVTVAAFIEGNYQQPAEGEAAAEPVYAGLTPQEIARYKEIIENVVGEGDEPTVVAVYDQAFETGPLAGAPAVAGPSMLSLEAPWFQWTWRIALVALMFLVIRSLMRRALVLPAAEEEEVVEIPEASPAERRRQEIAAEVERLSQQEPQTVAALLRTWMGQED